ncbi:MAG: hypothetical protein AAB847_01525 [Patescibacteria group bacterium]
MHQCSQEIRNKLSEIVSPKNESWWTPELFEKNVRNILPHEIEIVEPPPIEQKQYNCFIFALGLENDKKFVGNHSSEDSAFYQLSFFPKLIKSGLLTITITPAPGDLILYKNEKGVMTHAGKMESSDIVISKWSWGPLVRHNIWCVPKHYGNKIIYCNKPDDISLTKIIEFEEKLL